ncbi:hypothetical protein [Nocardia wallacei]|uniref:PE domain-containing protein n=1 Tax=Nocardia wallacei TaxID=480035 RepID=A0A7G1KJQ3_9NOCA|nr:hypothetical protein [Nocardia wallacei]BCK55300.1 hypothetical protein NWFMUON74_30720 [Nocardia wallacei]
MSFEVVPEHLPSTSAKLDTALVGVADTVLGAVEAAVAAPPGFDGASAQILPVTFAHAAEFFPRTLEMIGRGEEAAAVLPIIAAEFTRADQYGADSVGSVHIAD